MCNSITSSNICCKWVAKCFLVQTLSKFYKSQTLKKSIFVNFKTFDGVIFNFLPNVYRNFKSLNFKHRSICTNFYITNTLQTPFTLYFSTESPSRGIFDPPWQIGLIISCLAGFSCKGNNMESYMCE